MAEEAASCLPGASLSAVARDSSTGDIYGVTRLNLPETGVEDCTAWVLWAGMCLFRTRN